jgi:hypothetical protein
MDLQRNRHALKQDWSVLRDLGVTSKIDILMVLPDCPEFVATGLALCALGCYHDSQSPCPQLTAVLPRLRSSSVVHQSILAPLQGGGKCSLLA